MKNNIHLLVTARDPASANDIFQILPQFINNEQFSVKVIAQEPAYSILTHGEVNFDTSLVSLVEHNEDTGFEDIKSTLKEALQTFRPNCLLTGISGPDYGVDEIALSLCSTDSAVKSFSIQSYWGDLNKSCGVLADTIFVLDEVASKVTVARYASCKTVITGPLQATRYDNFDIEKNREKFRAEYVAEKNTTILALFGQPLFEYEWYRNTLQQFVEAASNVTPHVRILYKPHPKESDDSIKWMSDKLHKLMEGSFVVKDVETLTLLAGSDAAVSLFSTIGYDLQNILLRSETAFSVPVYLFFNKDCIKWYQEYCKLQAIPMSDEMSVSIKYDSTLEKELEKMISPEFKKECHTTIKQHFPAAGKDAYSVMADTFICSVNSSKVQ